MNTPDDPVRASVAGCALIVGDVLRVHEIDRLVIIEVDWVNGPLGKVSTFYGPAAVQIEEASPEAHVEVVVMSESGQVQCLVSSQ